MSDIHDYTTEDERAALISEHEAAGQTMKHDDHLDDGKRLTFGVYPDSPGTDPVQVRRNVLVGKLRDDTMNLPDLLELMRIERGL